MGLNFKVMSVQILLCKNNHHTGCFSFFLTLYGQSLHMQSDICFPAFPPTNLSIFAAFCFSFAVAGFAPFFFFPEEPPPRPPQPAVLIKSKCGFPQQLLTHCSCPLCSLLAPLLKGTSHSFLSFFAVIDIYFYFLS